jgi:2-polyprenyl-3-methyl-5-hydroxy-6-metoxy-1,4-benzoquinol methylase
MDRTKVMRLIGVVKDCMKVMDHHTDVVRKCLVQIEEEMGVAPNVSISYGGDKKANPGFSVKVNGVPIADPHKPKVEQSLDVSKKLIADPEWPKAVDEDAVCDIESAEDLMYRGEQIIDNMIDRNLEGVRFLDFGCGDGYVVDAALARGVAEAVGYDIKEKNWNFPEKANRWYTTEFNDLESRAYDVILLYDVLDHCEKPIEVLNRIGMLLAPNGVVYVRCQPWTSRHGGHMWRQINKAYIHLAVDDDHLKKLGYKVEPVTKVLRPLRTYKEWFAQTNFKVKKEDVSTEVLENYFHKDNIKKILHRHWDTERLKEPALNDQKINQILEIEFADFVLQQQGIF